MAAWLRALAKWCPLPAGDGFAELDKQIEKLRRLRDDYHVLPIQQQPDKSIDLKKGEEQLCTQ
ncbi:MAG TPA: hypothetical protein VGJ93_14655 [Desulfuromonadaceae bacterium]|jgi:hypothetical protein